MNISDALKAIELSISKGTSSPFPGVEDREAEMEKEVELLKDCVVKPEKVKVSGATFPGADLQEFANRETFVIAKDEARNLLYQPSTNLFALAYGNSIDSMAILGFYSEDALAEWRG